MYRLVSTKPFDKDFKDLTKKNKELKERIVKAFQLLKRDPFYESLKTHKVSTKIFGQRYSSWVTGDIRIIWDFYEEGTLTIILLDIGKHSGARKVYT